MQFFVRSKIITKGSNNFLETIYNKASLIYIS